MAPALPRPRTRDPRGRRRGHRERLDVLRDADAILQDEIRKAGLYRELWQSFCVLPDVRTVGVQGDERTYGYVVVIRAVTSDDAMTADWARLPYDLLEQIASRMINELREVNRVVLDITVEAPRHHRMGVSLAGVSPRLPASSLARVLRTPRSLRPGRHDDRTRDGRTAAVQPATVASRVGSLRPRSVTGSPMRQWAASARSARSTAASEASTR